MSRTRDNLLGLLRVAVALAIVAAIAFQYGRDSARDAFDPVNFFSFFTILSNIAAALLLAWEAVRPPATHGAAASAIRGAITLYMCITGLVYSVLLGPADIGGPEPWVNLVVHFIAPIVVAVDWFANPPRRMPGRVVIVAWLVPPSAYLIYSLVRGSDTGWYPYPFLDPDEAGGYADVAAYSAGVLAAFVVIALILHWWADRSRGAVPAAA